jgi:hypothetical protein
MRDRESVPESHITVVIKLYRGKASATASRTAVDLPVGSATALLYDLPAQYEGYTVQYE